ncbi:MAG: E2/UBC family protein [Chloroflexota bacterium]
MSTDSVVIHFGHDKYKVDKDAMSGTELRRLFGVPPADNLYRAKGSKVDGPAITDDEIVPLKNGDHFTSAPRDVSGGAPSDGPSLPSRIRREVERIESDFGDAGPVEVVADPSGQRVLIYRSHSHGWKPDPVTLLLRIPPLYPDEQPDLLFLEEGAAGPHGVPRLMQCGVPFAGRAWQQVSWHLTGPYDPGRENLAGFASSARLYLRDQSA